MNIDVPGDEIAQLRKAYLEALRAGSGRQADLVVEQSLDRKLSANQVYLDIFQPTAYEIGKLWQQNLVTVAQEHLATAIIERQMGQMHAYFHPTITRARTLVLGSIAKEQHRLGAQMVADFFEQDGWTVYYLGATTPVNEFIGLAREVNADMIGISVQMLYHLPQVIDLIQELDLRGMGGLPVIAGGQPFIQQSDLYRSLSLQFSAENAAAAVAQANQFFAEA
jgi:methanogenic corrinoid protein MtbC1